jgi:hypothetical protein
VNYSWNNYSWLPLSAFAGADCTAFFDVILDFDKTLQEVTYCNIATSQQNDVCHVLGTIALHAQFV